MRELVRRPRTVRIAAADVMVGRAVLGDPQRPVMLRKRGCERRFPRRLGTDAANARDARTSRARRVGFEDVHLHFNYCSAPHGRRAAAPDEQLSAFARVVRGRARLHGRRRGGVRDPRPRDARARQPLRGAPGGRAGHGARGAPRRRADRVRGRGAYRPVRDFGPKRARRWASAARSSSSSPARSGSRSAPPARIRGAAGRTSGSSTRRTTGATTSSSATWSGATTRSACTSTSASGAPTAPSRVLDALRHYLPELLALSAARPSSRTSNTGLHSARTQIFTRMFPRCGVPDPFGSWHEFEDYVRFLYATGSIAEHTQLWWSVRPHLAFPTVEIRICDAQPDLAESQALAALMYALAAASRVRSTRASRCRPSGPPASRRTCGARSATGSSGELIDLATRRRSCRRARALEQLVEWVAPGRRRDRRAARVPAANAAERQRARLEEGATLREIYAEQVIEPVRAGVHARAAARAAPAVARLRRARLDGDDLASLAYAKLDAEARELDEARLAIDAIRALVPCSRVRAGGARSGSRQIAGEPPARVRGRASAGPVE